MSASPIATNITFDEVFGSLLVGASIVLTTHSLSRMIFLRRTGSKYQLFPIINVTQFINQWCVFLLICTAFNTISRKTALWLNVVINIAYFISKPVTMYLAYLRCSAVFPAFQKFAWIHYFLIGFRAIELFVIVIINIIQNELCEGSVAKGTRCEQYAIAWTFRDAGAPVFRIYYILCEGIFYYKLFATLKKMSVRKNQKLIQYRRLQTSLFTVDLILLIIMSIYRIIGIFNKSLPTYVYYELFSSTLTIFNLTEFGLNIRMLFGTVISDKSNENGSTSGSSPSKLEMGSIHRSSRSQAQTPVPETWRHNSISPLTRFAAETGHGDFDIIDPYNLATMSPNAKPPTPPTAISFSNNNNTNNNNNSSLAYPEEWSRAASPVPQQQQLDMYILAPSSFQSQARSGFYEEVEQRQDIVAKPNRAALPERSTRR
ncbi:hypothetical protein BG006_007989 [Podila minutissima]|uniref:Uncharacterized protein n=1 Tax=Podila minutissima TaxID=64525 RepID=A0A9P5SH40_9FUNG|nr:hypothetical protein BG006_007989 [Podila minutissima]